MMKNIFILFLICASQILTAQNDADHTSSMKFVSYSPGNYAPLGIMGGKIWKKGVGFYLSGRVNFAVLTKSQYHFDGSAIDDHSLNWFYTGEKRYSRWELNAGAIVTLLRIKGVGNLNIYLGTGVEKPRYLYAYSHSNSFGNSSTWVVFNEISKRNINSEAGIMFSFSDNFNIHFGLSTIHKKHERMFEFGIGIPLKSKE